MRYVALVALALILFTPIPASAEFVGDLEFTPTGCESTGSCEIKKDFKYIDPQKVEWLTTPPDKTDGATIPPWAQPFIGTPFEKDFIKAAVIHDHYCDREVRPWRQTHRVLYDALIESGVSVAKSKLMYYAVYFAGPKWIKLMPPRTCPGSKPGVDCVFKVKPGASTEATISRAAQYNQSGFVDELKAVEKLIAEQGDQVDLGALESRAQARQPDDFFYTHGDSIEVGDSGAAK
jgi:hypothetical protein